MAHRHQLHQLDPCGVRGIDDAAVSLDFTGFSEAHPSCLLDLKVQNSYAETYRRVILQAKI